MKFTRIIMNRLRGLASRRSIEAEVAEELEAHIRLLVERNVANGMPPVSARFAAEQQFGDIMLIRRQIRRLYGR